MELRRRLQLLTNLNACGGSAVKPPQYCRLRLRGSWPSRVIRPRRTRNPIMKRPPGAAGFSGQSTPVASSRLIDAVAASLALSAFSLCLAVALTVLTLKAGLTI